MRNYWGYDPIALFAPAAAYSSGSSNQQVLIEFKTMVRELHRAGIEVILDVVFNPTAEAWERGPAFSFRGLDKSIYYLLNPSTFEYLDYTGCGNTLNCNHPVVRTMIRDCLHHWVTNCHIDGFRFDLAAILGRGTDGKTLANPPLLEEIAEDPVLRQTKLIAEAWDLGGAYEVGRFPGRRWAEWNNAFRDDVRRFWRGDAGYKGLFATRLAGSSDLYQSRGDGPVKSVNYVTCHDGFTLNDLVSYACKHNENNGEANRDGASENYSENNGAQGTCVDIEIETIRVRQIKNFLLTLFMSRGVPMLLGGDEFRRSQNGNNNAYCQDNEISWVDWRLLDTNREIFDFLTALIAFRRVHPILNAEAFYTDADISWFDERGSSPDWSGSENVLGCLVRESESSALCLLFNATLLPKSFALPASPARRWRLEFNTAEPTICTRRVCLGSEEVIAPLRSGIVLSSCE